MADPPAGDAAPAPPPALSGDVAPARAVSATDAPARPSGPRALHPSQVKVWRVGYGVSSLVLVVLLDAADWAVRLADGVELPWPRGAPAVPVAVLLGVLVWRLPRLAYERWRYELAPETLELQRGVVVQSHTAIPYFRVQHIDITRSPIERSLGLSQLVVRTAAATTDATIPGVAASEAESLRDVILARTGRDDAV